MIQTVQPAASARQMPLGSSQEFTSPRGQGMVASALALRLWNETLRMKGTPFSLNLIVQLQRLPS